MKRFFPSTLSLLFLLLGLSNGILFADSFLSSTTPISPFVEENTLGRLSPAMLRTSPAIFYNRAITPYCPYSDFSFAYRPVDFPDVFNAGFSFNRTLTPQISVAAAFQALLVGSIENISDAIFNKFSQFQYFNFSPSFAYRLLPQLTIALETELSVFQYFGDSKFDFNASLQGAYEIKGKTFIFENPLIGLTANNVVGLFYSNASPFDVSATITTTSLDSALSYGLGFTLKPGVGAWQNQDSIFYMDLGASVKLFKLWRLNAALVRIGQANLNLNFSTSIDIMPFHFSYGIQNIVPNTASLFRGGSLEHVVSVSLYYDFQQKAAPVVPKVNPVEVENKKRLNASLEKLYESGRKNFEAKQYFAAKKDFEEVRNLDPANEVAIRYLTLLVAVFAEEKKKAQEMALVQFNRRNYQEAMESAHYGLMFDPLDKNLLELKGFIGEQLSKEQLKQESYTMFLEGLTEYQLQNYEGALKLWNKILEKDKDNKMVGDYIEKAELALKNKN